MRHLLVPLVLVFCAACAAPTQPTTASATKNAAADLRARSAVLTSKQLLLGKWRHIDLVRVVSGKRLAPQPGNGNDFAEFDSTTWSSIGPNFRSAGTYRWIDDQTIETTIIESNLAIQLGIVSKKRVVVDQGQLQLIVEQSAAERAKVMPPPPIGASQQIDTIVITRFARVRS
jgi:hypothetical protein